MKKIFTIISFMLLTVGLSSGYASDDWLANEVLTQLSDMRRSMGNLKEQVQQLQAEVKSLKSKAVNARAKPALTSFDIGEGKSLGKDTSAKYAIVEFTDYQCPYCAKHNQKTLGKIKEQYVDSGKLQYFIRDFPLGFHSQALPAAIAASCAQEQGTYAEMHDQLFRNSTKLSNALYKQLAAELGLDKEQFASCLTDAEQAGKIDREIALGQSIGINGTPAFLIGRLQDGQLTDVKALSGAQPFSSFSRIIESTIN